MVGSQWATGLEDFAGLPHQHTLQLARSSSKWTSTIFSPPNSLQLARFSREDCADSSRAILGKPQRVMGGGLCWFTQNNTRQASRDIPSVIVLCSFRHTNTVSSPNYLRFAGECRGGGGWNEVETLLAHPQQLQASCREQKWGLC